jgi:cold shock CspA family protein
MTGELRIYDKSAGWALITGDDACLYIVRRDQVADADLRAGDRVSFDAMRGPGGLRAERVRRKLSGAGFSALKR